MVGNARFSFLLFFFFLGIPCFTFAEATAASEEIETDVDLPLNSARIAAPAYASDYAPYCGDKIKNQDWEQCDGDKNCQATCQVKNQPACDGLVLAKVNVRSVLNWGNGNLKSDLFLGSRYNRIPSNVWFAITDRKGVSLIDADRAAGNYENVPGLAIERQDGKIRVTLFGNHINRDGKEHVHGSIKFWRSGIVSLDSDHLPGYKLEKGLDGTIKGYSPGNDEVSGFNRTAYFWLTVTGAKDSFIAGYSPKWSCLPNIVVLMSDDQDDKGSIELMEKLNTLVGKNGVRFKNSFTNFPLCCPSRAGFLTGQCVMNSGVKGNSPKSGGGYQKLLPTEGNTLPVWLQKAGYTTALIGKYLNGWETMNKWSPYVPKVPPGWSVWRGMKNTYSYYGYSIMLEDRLEYHGGYDEATRTITDPSQYQTDVLALKAEDFIMAQTGTQKPFFIWLTPMAPHNGHPARHQTGRRGDAVPPERYRNTLAGFELPQGPNFNMVNKNQPEFVSNRPALTPEEISSLKVMYRNHRGAIKGVDDMVETVINALKKAGKLENTVFIYTSDNGYFHGEHRKMSGKEWIYDEGIRVPLLMSGPGIPRGMVEDRLVENVDLTATIVDIANAVPGRELDGHSLMDLFDNPQDNWRTAIIVEGISFPNRSIGVRTNGYMFAQHRVKNAPVVEEEMYDMTTDPNQLNNLIKKPEYLTVRKWLRQALKTLSNCKGSSCWYTNKEPASSGILLNRSHSAEVIEPLVDMTSLELVRETNPAYELISAPIKPGDKNDDVRKLQMFLSRDNSIYPEGTISGFYTVETQTAVKRFQEQYRHSLLTARGLNTASGIADMETISKINEILLYEYELMTVGE